MDTLLDPVRGTEPAASRAADGDPAGAACGIGPGSEVGGRYRVERELGHGGMGTVFVAFDPQIARRVALKVLAGGPRTPRALERFEQEARAAGALEHPNVVAVHDAGSWQGEPYLVSELLEGETLGARLSRGPLALREVVGLAVQLASGLAAAHAKGIVHRDLKPENVFLTRDGRVKILDFGIAKLLAAPGDPDAEPGAPGSLAPVGTQAGAILGTPQYMSPEQADGRSTDARSDVFALGVMLHRLLAGKVPFPPGAELGLAGNAPPPRLPGAPAALTRLVARMLARDPAARPADGRELHRELSALQRALEPKTALRVTGAVAALAILLAAGIALRPRPRPLPPGRLLVALADAANSTGDAGLDGLSILLEKALEQSRRVSLIARSRLVLLLRDTGDEPGKGIGERLARKAAQAAQAHVLLLPAVRPAGGDFDVEVRAVEPAHDETLFTARERVPGKAAVLPALDRLSDQVREELQEDPKDAALPRVRVAQVIPSNPEAWRLYAETQRLRSEGRVAEAQQVSKRVLQIEPDFPLAHLDIAWSVDYLDEDLYVRSLEVARRGMDRLPPKERLWVEAMLVERSSATLYAVSLLDRAIAGWPQDPRAYELAAYFFTDSMADREGARPYLEKALELAALAPDQAIRYALFLDRRDQALALARRWVERVPEVASYRALATVHRVRGEPAESLAAARKALSLAPRPGGLVWSFSSPLLWSFAAADALDELERVWPANGARPYALLDLQGQRRAAVAAFDRARPPDSAPEVTRALFHNTRASFLAFDCDAQAVWREVQQAFELGTSTVVCLPIDLAVAGDALQAERMMRNFVGQDLGVCYKLARALVAWRRGDREAAIRGLSAMLMPHATYSLGLVLGEAGRDREAVEALRTFRRWPEWDNNMVSVGRAWAESLYYEAAALERLGDRAGALASVERLLRLWKNADKDLRLLGEARALHARLRSPPAPAK